MHRAGDLMPETAGSYWFKVMKPHWGGCGLAGLCDSLGVGCPRALLVLVSVDLDVELSVASLAPGLPTTYHPS